MFVSFSSNRSWAIECSALYHRSVLECSDKHAQDRALQQLEELSALFDRLHAPTTVASSAELANAKSIDDYAREDVIRIRMRDVYLSNYPSIWTLKQGIAATVRDKEQRRSSIFCAHAEGSLLRLFRCFSHLCFSLFRCA